jgi:hypothetical protein
MTRRARCFSGAFVGLGLLLASQAFVSVSSATPDRSSLPTEGSCAALKRWAQSYRDARPTLDELATFDRAHRIAIFNAVTPDVRSALWQDQLHRFSERTDLTSTQRALITEGASLMTPALYDREPNATAAYKSFWTRADSAFSASSHRQTWFDLGSVVNGAPRATAAFGLCTCAIGGSGECGTKTCATASCTQWGGCGSGGAAACDGTCQ